MEDRHAIRSLHRKGHSINSIASIMGSSWRTARRWSRRSSVRDLARTPLQNGTKKEKNCRILLKRGYSLRRTATEVGISAGTVRKLCRRSQKHPSGLFPYKAIRKLRLKVAQRQKRVQYVNTVVGSCRENTIRKLKQRIVYDEKKWEVGCVPNKQNTRFWNETGDNEDRTFSVDSYPSTIHVFAAISYFDKSGLRWYVADTQSQRKFNFSQDVFRNVLYMQHINIFLCHLRPQLILFDKFCSHLRDLKVNYIQKLRLNGKETTRLLILH
jgi:transposase